jgi:3-oxoacyl-[acyl-carrier-protein] synthase III
MIKILADTLKKAALKPDDISLVLTHNGSFPWWDKIMETMRISPDLIFKGNNDVTAHLMSSDILSNLRACREQQLLKPGDKFIILNAGVGRTFGCAVAQA